MFYPEAPDRYQVVYKLCLINGDRMTSDLRAEHDVVQKHIKTTTHDPYVELDGMSKVLNRDCCDISKARVQKVFASVFGYDLEVDPATYKGPAVRKSDANYAHDGIIIDCPVAPDKNGGVVYQRFVDTENSDGYCVDHRVPIYGDQIPLVYLKYKPASDRFDAIVRADIVAPQNVFSEEERRQIIEFARAMGLDFGELDVLRDNTDGRIYIVDVNNTPAGPERGLTAEQKKHAAGILAGAYRRLVEDFSFDGS